MLILDQGSRLQGFCGGADEGHGQSKVWGDVCASGKPLCSVSAASFLVSALVVPGWTFQTAPFLAL